MSQVNEEEKLTILIVDDNPINCKVLMSSLEVYEQYRLLVAHTGGKAVTIAEKAIPDLILLDINLPEMNGFEVCEKLKINPQTKEIPIIFLSALDDVESKVKGFTVGGVDYITKPFYKEEVIKRVETQLEIQRLTRSLQSHNQVLADMNDELLRLLNEIGTMQMKLEESHEQITGSINYALRIQSALLPPTHLIRKSVADFFNIYIPRDIVSGDFYWYGYVDGKIIIAAIDCTGHGVPGALMSVIGYTQLHSIIYESQIRDASQILEALDQRVRLILKQDETTGENKTHDGMDIILTIFDLKKSVLDFSGANLPLFHCREGQIEEYKGNTFPIGGTQYDNKVYESQQIEIKEGDIIYLFSDGFQDQFGGENGRKLTRRRLKEVIQEMTQISMEGQKDGLLDFLKEWKGNYDQTDDILLMGVKYK